MSIFLLEEISAELEKKQKAILQLKSKWSRAARQASGAFRVSLIIMAMNLPQVTKSEVTQKIVNILLSDREYWDQGIYLGGRVCKNSLLQNATCS